MKVSLDISDIEAQLHGGGVTTPATVRLRPDSVEVEVHVPDVYFTVQFVLNNAKVQMVVRHYHGDAPEKVQVTTIYDFVIDRVPVSPLDAYRMLRAGDKTCPQCGSGSIVLLAGADMSQPAFYLCRACSHIAQVGVGPLSLAQEDVDD